VKREKMDTMAKMVCLEKKDCLALQDQGEEREDLVLLDLLDKRVIKEEMVLMACQADLDLLESLVS
jgi:hypothetical protein